MLTACNARSIEAGSGLALTFQSRHVRSTRSVTVVPAATFLGDETYVSPRWIETVAAMVPGPVIHPPQPEGTMHSFWQAFWAEDSGQGLVEYALIIALVAVGLIAILLVLRNSIGNVFNNAATQLNNAPTNPYP